MISEDEFLTHLPECDACGEILPPGLGPFAAVVLEKVERRGLSVISTEWLYHVACAPKKSDGSSYAAGCTTRIEVAP